jgi:hypothetical protein
MEGMRKIRKRSNERNRKKMEATIDENSRVLNDNL